MVSVLFHCVARDGARRGAPPQRGEMSRMCAMWRRAVTAAARHRVEAHAHVWRVESQGRQAAEQNETIDGYTIAVGLRTSDTKNKYRESRSTEPWDDTAVEVCFDAGRQVTGARTPRGQ